MVKKTLQKKMKIFLIIGILFGIIQLIAGDVQVGTCEGYILNTEEEVVEGANVVVTVDNCIVQCSQTTTSESTGYYVVANLNLPKYESLTVYAEKMTPLGLEFGQATGIANEFQAAYVNVTICLPPPEPSLVDEPNTHNTSLILEWTSYADKKGYDTYDQFRLDSGEIIEFPGSGSKSKEVSGLSFSQHKWEVRTCNPFCCSSWVSDSFNIGNLPPTPPNLTDQLDTAPGEVTLEWTSGIDPDGDETYDEFCYGIVFENETCSQGVSSPQIVEVFGCNYYLWKVRTCEVESQRLCSSWSVDGFIACGLECPQCVCISRSFTGREIEAPEKKEKYSLVINSPLSVEEKTEFPLKISFQTKEKVKNVLFKIKSSDFQFENFLIPELQNAKAKFKLIGKVKETTNAGDYNFTLEVYVSNKKEFSEDISIKVTKPLLINIKRITMEIPKKKNFWIVLLIIGMLSGIYYFIKKWQETKKHKIVKQKINKHH